jgi:hypothetical protein
MDANPREATAVLREVFQQTSEDNPVDQDVRVAVKVMLIGRRD